MVRPPFAFSAVRIPCAQCNRHFRSQAGFKNNNQITSKNKSICERKRSCGTCGVLKSSNKHECSKRYCDTCKQNREVGHLCYMRSLKDVLPAKQTRQCTYFMILRTPKISCIPTRRKLMCPTSSVTNSSVRGVRRWMMTDCERCGKRRHSFCDDPVGDLLTYLCEPRPWAKKLGRSCITPRHMNCTSF